LETDRRIITRRITQLRGEIEEVRAHRSRYRAQRRKAGAHAVAIVGYTNAGKSTLLNALSGARILVADQLFATLDPTTRRVKLPDGGVALFTDTVGFIQKLPTQLVAAFRATLEEVTEADLLVHVLDGTHPQVMRQAVVVSETLEEIGAVGKPTIPALNKVDRLTPAALSALQNAFPGGIPISALAGEGLDDLLALVEERLEMQMVWLDVLVPYESGELVDLFHRCGLIEQEAHTGEGTHIVGRVPHMLAGRFDGLRPPLPND
jgi:GTP-binding protein HflX